MKRPVHHYLKSLNIKQKLNKTADYCLLISMITVLSGAIYYNVFYYERHKNKNPTRPRF